MTTQFSFNWRCFKNLLGMALALICLPFDGMTQTTSQPLEITITAGRLDNVLSQTPAAASVLTDDQLHGARQQLGLDEALAGVPGVFALNRYNFAQDLRLSIRGFGARANFGIRGVRILIDGIPATTPDGQSSVDDIDLDSLERIEVLRGPAGALYGPSAGGLLNLESRHSKSAPHAEFSVKGGNYGFREYRLKGNDTHSRLGYSLNVSRLRIEGYRAQSAAERTLLNGRVDHEFGNGDELSATLALLDAPIAQDAGGLTNEQAREEPSQAAPLNRRFDTGESVRQQRLGVRTRHTLTSGAQLRLRSYFVHRDFANRLPFNVVELDRRFGGIGVEYLHETAWLNRPGRLLLGLDLDRQDDARRRRENLDGIAGETTFNQREEVTNSGIFLAHEQLLTNRLRLDAGLRYDRLRISADDRFISDGDDSGVRTFAHWSPSAALWLETGETTHLYARIATGFETPTTTELARADGGGGFNDSLAPETSVNYELGTRTLPTPGVQMEAAVFQIDIHDQLVPFEIAGSPGRFAYENAGRSRNRGLETALSLGGRYGWGIQLAYTYSDFRFVKFSDQTGMFLNGKRLPGVPKHLLNLEVRYRHSSDFYTALETRYTGRYDADNLNTVEIAASTVTSLRVHIPYTYDNWQFNTVAGINNLFDENYYANVRFNAAAGRYYEPAPPRHGYIGINVGRYF